MPQFTGVPPRPIEGRHARFVLILALAISATAGQCDPSPRNPPAQQAHVTRERAIEIARKQVSFQPDTVDAVQATSEGPDRPAVWRVTVKGRLPDQPPGLFETRIFEIDVRTGEIVGSAMN